LLYENYYVHNLIKNCGFQGAKLQILPILGMGCQLLVLWGVGRRNGENEIAVTKQKKMTPGCYGFFCNERGQNAKFPLYLIR
jgi:hypothetical protein